MKNWNQSVEFKKWNDLVSSSIDSFRRPYMLFDFNGRFMTRNACLTNKKEPAKDMRIDMPEEYVLFAVEALKKFQLMSNSEKVSVAFVENVWFKKHMQEEARAFLGLSTGIRRDIHVQMRKVEPFKVSSENAFILDF